LEERYRSSRMRKLCLLLVLLFGTFAPRLGASDSLCVDQLLTLSMLREVTIQLPLNIQKIWTTQFIPVLQKAIPTARYDITDSRLQSQRPAFGKVKEAIGRRNTQKHLISLLVELERTKAINEAQIESFSLLVFQSMPIFMAARARKRSEGETFREFLAVLEQIRLSLQMSVNPSHVKTLVLDDLCANQNPFRTWYLQERTRIEDKFSSLEEFLLHPPESRGRLKCSRRPLREEFPTNP
jgi:hypothetical protein